MTSRKLRWGEAASRLAQQLDCSNGMVEELQIDEPRVLVQRLARGDDGALRVLFDQYGNTVFRFAYRRLNSNHEDAEEVVLETFCSAAQLAPSFDGSANVRTWLCGIARIRVIDRLRKQGRDRRIPERALVSLSDPSLSVSAQLRGDSDLVEGVVQRLDLERLVSALGTTLLEAEHEALIMLHVEGFGIDEISQVLGRSGKAVKNLVARGRQKLRVAFEGWVEGS